MQRIKDTIYSKKSNIKCYGKEDELEHPAIYLKIPLNNKVICPYCSKEFIYVVQNKKLNKNAQSK